MLEKIRQILHINKPEITYPTVQEQIDEMFNDLTSESLRFYIGSDLNEHHAAISSAITKLREEIKEECGFVFPAVRVTSNDELQENECQLLVCEKVVATDFIIPKEEEVKSSIDKLLREGIDSNLRTIFSNEIVEKYIDFVQKNNGWLVWDITSRLSTVEVKEILVDILESKKSISKISYIFEKIAAELFLEERYSKDIHKISQSIKKYI